jgi:di/tricarboxylate transporter
MNADALTALVILTIGIILMVTEVLRADLVALLLAVTLALTGVVTPQEAFSGFSHSAVVTILAIFILTSGLSRTGITRRVGLALQRLAGGRPILLLLLTMLGGAALSLFMQNIAAAAVLMPALMDVARRTRTSPSKLLMPLAFGVNLGGMATLLATSNILVSATLQDLGLAPYGLLDFAPLGLALVAVGVLYMLLVGHRLLPSVSLSEEIGRIQRLRRELSDTYALGERLSEVRIPGKSPLVGKSIAASQIGERLGLTILAVCRDGQPACVAPGSEHILGAEDTLLIAGRDERVRQLADLGADVLETTTWDNSLSTDQTALLEVILAPRSNAAGHTLKELRFREKYGLSVVALWRGGRPYRTDVGNLQLQFGDALLVHGPRGNVSVLRADPDFLVLAEPDDPPRARKGWLAAIVMALTLVVVALDLLPIAVAMMLGALSMIVTGCLTVDEAYRGVEWRAIFLVAGMLPAGIALNRSGATEWLSQLLVTVLADWGPLALTQCWRTGGRWR